MNLLILGVLASALSGNPYALPLSTYVWYGAFFGLFLALIVIIRRRPRLKQLTQDIITALLLIAVGAGGGRLVGNAVNGILSGQQRPNPIPPNKPVKIVQRHFFQPGAHIAGMKFPVHADSNYALTAWWIDSRGVWIAETDLPPGCIDSGIAAYYVDPKTKLIGPTIFVTTSCTDGPHQITDGRIDDGLSGSIGFADGLLRETTLSPQCGLLTRSDPKPFPLLLIQPFGSDPTAIVPYFSDTATGTNIAVDTINLIPPAYVGDAYKWQCIGHGSSGATIHITVTAN